MKQKYWFALGVAVVGGTQSGACTAFRTCTETRSCATTSAGAPDEVAGEGGAGGTPEAGAGDVAGRGEAASETAGAAGEVPSAACAQDSDCANPDKTNCVVSCVETGGVAACVVQGVDTDGDGFRSAKCTAMPGDDCKDNDKTIHPGAVEVCDQVDNDCNGKVDINDALAVSGANVNLTHSLQIQPRVVVLPDNSGYGIGLLDKATKSLTFETVDAKGKVLLQPELITTAGLPADGFALTADAGLMSVAYMSGGSSVLFSTVTSHGGLGKLTQIAGIAPPLFADPALAHTTTGLWVLLYGVGDGNPGALQAKAFSDPAALDPNPAGLTFDVNGVANTHAVAVGDRVAAVFANATTSRASGLLANLADVSLSISIKLSGSLPVVGSRPKGFAIAVSGAAVADAPQFYAFSDKGVPNCGPVALGAAGEAPSSVVGSANGYLVTLVGSKGVSVQEVLADCTLGAYFVIDSTPTTSSAFIAGGATGYGIVWNGGDGLDFRAFGPNFCD